VNRALCGTGIGECMPRRISSAEMRSRLRQAQSKQKQAGVKNNREIRQRSEKVKQALNSCNSETRKHNVKVSANRQKVDSELRKMRSSSASQYQMVRSSAMTLNTYYERLDARESAFEYSTFGYDFLYRTEQGNTNRLALSNILESDAEDNECRQSDLLCTKIDDMLLELSPELGYRWKGVLFSLSPENPGAARHLCTVPRPSCCLGAHR
jgi:hypothetical protein